MIGKVSTKDLSEELEKREGVESIQIEPEESFTITTINGNGEIIVKEGAGPAIILINRD